LKATDNSSVLRQEAIIASKIFTIRDENVILDVHLAELQFSADFNKIFITPDIQIAIFQFWVMP